MKNIISNSMCLALFCLVLAPFSAFAQYTKQMSKFIPSPVSEGKTSIGENEFQGSSVKTNNFDDLLSKARNDRNTSVIVGLNMVTIPEGFLGDDQKIEQRNAIKDMQNDLISQLSRFHNRILAKYDYIPFIALTVNEDLLKFLNESPLVSSIEENKQHELSLAQSIPIIGADDAWNMGYTGSGKVIAIIDSGVDKVHPFLANKVVSEACYSQPTNDLPEVGGTENLCGGFTDRTDPGSGVPCAYGTTNGVCAHGTHVAGIAAGNGTNSGVAKDANLISIMVMSRFYQYLPNGHTSSAVRASTIDILKGLERVLYLKNNTTLDITSVNISIGDGIYNAPCGVGGSYEAAITNLKSVSIATVIASGNDNATNGISSPACVEPSVSVGATGDGSSYQLCNINGCTTYSTPIDQIWSVPSVGLGTNSADFLDLLAPGSAITSSVPGGGFATYSGTSMAAPHVAGAWAILRQRFPNASVDQILNALKVTGTPITDTRSGANNRVKPRINVDLALIYLQQQLRKPRFDFNYDGKTDVSVFRPSNATWYVRNTDGTSIQYNFGLSTDKLVPDDFSGDGRTDLVVWRGSTGEWHIYNIATSTFSGFQFGLSGDIPATGDFDGDGKADAVAYRPSEGRWYILQSTAGYSTTQFGIAEDKPVVEDYDGDGKADIAIYRPSVSEWWILRSSDNAVYSVQFGASGDKTVQGDYTGDGKADLAIFRPSTGFWYILRSETPGSYYGHQFGLSTDIAVPGDYDGDGKTDVAVFRPSEGNWYISGSTSGYQIVYYGISTDTPIPNVYSVP